MHVTFEFCFSIKFDYTLNTFKGRYLSFYARVVTLKGPITKPIQTKVNIVNTFVTKIKRYRDDY